MTAHKVKSPCVNLCSLNDDDVCIGCYRTGQEISRWGRLTPQQQRAVLIKVRKREKASPFVNQTKR